MTAPDTATASYAPVEPVFKRTVPALVSRLPVIESVPVAVALPGARVPWFTKVPP